MADKDGGDRRATFRFLCTLAALIVLTAYISVSIQPSNRLRQESNGKINTEGESTNRARLLSNIFSDEETTTRTWTTPTGVEIQTRIVGGTDVADPNLFPSYGFSAGDGLCGGTLIYPDIVLTAAHCTTVFNDGWQQGGITIDGLGSQRVDVAQSMPHPDYEPGPEYNDIMLVKLAEPIVDAPIQKLNFNPDVPSVGATVTVIGFGNTADGGNPSFNLQQVQSTTVAYDVCNGYYGTIVDEKQICMDSTQGKDSCQGDSGGPLFADDGTQVGLVSYGVGCADPNSPASVFTRISGYEQWINDSICELSSQPPASCAGASTPPPVAAPSDSSSPVATKDAPIAAPAGTSTSAPVGSPSDISPPSATTEAPIAAPVPTVPSAVTRAPMDTPVPPIAAPNAGGTGATAVPSPVATTPAPAPTTGSTAAPISPTSITAVPAAPTGTTAAPIPSVASPMLRPAMSPVTNGAPTSPLAPTSKAVAATKAQTSKKNKNQGSSKGGKRMNFKRWKGMQPSSPTTQRKPKVQAPASTPTAESSVSPPINSPTGKTSKLMKSKGGSGAATTAVPPPVNFPTWKSSKRTTSKGGAASKSNGQRDKRWGDFAAEINPTSSSSHNDKTSGSKGKSTKGNGISNIFERDNPDDERVERINQLWSMIAAARRDDRFDDNETIDRDIQQQPNYVNINDRWRNTQQSNNP